MTEQPKSWAWYRIGFVSAGSSQASGNDGAVPCLNHRPAVVFATGTGRGLEVDFFEAIGSDIPDEHVARLAIEAEAPGIAKTVGPYFLPGPGLADERIRWRNGIWFAAVVIDIHIDAKDLAKQIVQRLRPLASFVWRASVAGGYVEVAVGTELELPRVMCVVGLIKASARPSRNPGRPHLGRRETPATERSRSCRTPPELSV